MQLSRRGLLRTAAVTSLAAPLALGTTGASAAANGYAGLRIGKPQPTTATVPEITLPAGYTFVAGANNSFASPWQYYTYIQGPASDSVPVTINWPGEQIDAVISKSARLPLIKRGRSTATVTLPVNDTRIDSLNLGIRTALPTDASIFSRIEHNDPARAAGPWTTTPWPAAEVKAVVNFLVASERILRDSGLSRTAAGRGHTWYITGFETYTTLHPDNPSHWHLGYYPGPKDTPGSFMPHIWLDKAGKIFYNRVDHDGGTSVPYHVGEPAPLTDAEGNVVVTLTVRADGGLDIAGPGGPTYAIQPLPGRTPADGVRVVKAGKLLQTIVTSDQPRAGRLTIAAISTGGRPTIVTHRYDRHLGRLL